MEAPEHNFPAEPKQPWKQWLAKEINARREAEVDESKAAEQERLRREYEGSEDAQRLLCKYPDNASG